ncbi:MAG: S-layer homology domain-containing protein, partial [Actinomycetota bacterium]|nr:S-layer homology domain-containing protein [Actinomycetota bacterium]
MLIAGLAVAPPVASAGEVFDDVEDTSLFAESIEWLAGVGVTQGCNPPTNTRFCPNDVVTRGQMAAFLVRALSLPAASGIDFVDDNGSVYESNIERLAAAGITRGCNPPTNDRFCPDDVVTRGQMAAFLTRALGLPAATGIDFTDDNDSVFESSIESLAAAGITRGCNPPTNDRFCPDDVVTRGQMAAFLHRALGDQLFVRTYLVDLSKVDGSTASEGSAEIDGNLYTKSIFWSDSTNYSSDWWTEHNLSRDYTHLCAAVGLSDNSDADLELEVEVYVDGISKWVQTIGLGETIPLAISVTDGLRLRIASRPGSATSASGTIV